MTTPTHHTSSSLFVFSDMLEPDQSESSLEQNSSIEESNIFVSGEISGHTRFSSSTLSAARNARVASSEGQSLLGPLEEESELPVATIATATATAALKKSKGNTDKIDNAGILKPPSYLQQKQQPHQQQSRLAVTTDPGMNEISNPVTLPNRKSNAVSSNVSHVPPPFDLPSPTLHTSNQTPMVLTEEKIKRDSITRATTGDFVSDNNDERVAAWSIHVALIFFCGLVIASVILTFTVIRDYGFITLVLTGFVIIFCGFLACFVDNTILATNPKLRPVRQKILTVIHATRRILEEEYRLFIHDWKENLLLTQGSSQNFTEVQTNNPMDNNNSKSNNNSRIRPLPTTPQQQRKKQSKVFRMIRPLLGLKKKIFRGRRQHEQKQKFESAIGNDAIYPSSNHSPSYEPPPPPPQPVADGNSPKLTMHA
mmetsp:Transcript_69443/g.77677  ORF Transcript_69443/g.77677 Transcript_69443/m.77677 type:complete len:425 (+) Transcript_69443:64-1338(+)